MLVNGSSILTHEAFLMKLKKKLNHIYSCEQARSQNCAIVFKLIQRQLYFVQKDLQLPSLRSKTNPSKNCLKI